MEDMKRDLGTTCRLEVDVVVDLQSCRASKLACESESRKEQPHTVDFEWNAVLVLRAVRGNGIHNGEQQATQQLAGEQHWSQPASGARVRAAQCQPASGGRSARMSVLVNGAGGGQNGTLKAMSWASEYIYAHCELGQFLRASWWTKISFPPVSFYLLNGPFNPRIIVYRRSVSPIFSVFLPFRTV